MHSCFWPFSLYRKARTKGTNEGLKYFSLVISRVNQMLVIAFLFLVLIRCAGGDSQDAINVAKNASEVAIYCLCSPCPCIPPLLAPPPLVIPPPPPKPPGLPYPFCPPPPPEVILVPGSPNWLEPPGEEYRPPRDEYRPPGEVYPEDPAYRPSGSCRNLATSLLALGGAGGSLFLWW